mgnify:FL=1
MKRRFQSANGDIEVNVVESGGRIEGSVDGRPVSAARVLGPRGALALDLGRRRVLVWTHGAQVHVSGSTHDLPEVAPKRRGGSGNEGGSLTAPMPGTVLEVRVKVGDVVEKGQVLAVMEAMKMEHAVAAPRAGVVIRVAVKAGDRCGPGDALVELDG